MDEKPSSPSRYNPHLPIVDKEKAKPVAQKRKRIKYIAAEEIIQK